MGSLLDWVGQLPSWLLGLSPVWIYLAVGALVFAEDAIFIGFAIPGETAAVVGGVSAALGHTEVAPMAVVVVLAAIVGDSVGYEIGKHFFGPKILGARMFDRRRSAIQAAQRVLRRRGGLAVLLGRFTAFLRAMMPALAGASQMPYRRFLVWNAIGGIIWGTGFVVLGYVAGVSYETVAKTVGRDAAYVVAAIVVLGLLAWHLRRRRAHRAG